MARIMETVITPAHSGFGMWQENEFVDSGFRCLNDFFEELATNYWNVLEITDENIAEIEELGGEDIRGSVYPWGRSGKKRHYFILFDREGEPVYGAVTVG